MIAFTVHGRPIPQGSMRAFRHRFSGAVVNIPDNRKTKPWKDQISSAARMCKPVVNNPPTGPISVTLVFFFRRPHGAPKARIGHTVKPDLDKLIRAILDALKGILYKDDAQVIHVQASKHYALPERVEIEVEEM